MNNSKIIAKYKNIIENYSETLTKTPDNNCHLITYTQNANTYNHPISHETALLWLQYRNLDTDENIAQIIEIN